MHMIGSAQRPLVIGTRGSKLALTQTRMVAADLEQRGLAVRIETFVTEGDTNRASLSSLGGVGVFAAALRVALLEGRCDLVVHSLKDLPTVEVPGLVVAAIPARVDPADVLVARDGLRLADLPAAARVGTGSPRRARQLAAARPDLSLVDIRGNVPTRIGRVRGLGTRAEQIGLDQGRAKEDLDAVVLARAGLRRLGVEDVATDDLSETILPAGGQGALALETVADGLAAEEGRILAQTLRIVDDEPTRLEVSAERALLRYLEAGCAAPLGVRGQLTWENNATELLAGVLELRARVVGDNGESVEVSGETTVLLGTDADQRDFALAAAEQLGVDLATELLANGAGEMANLQAAKESGTTQS
ncbi:hydroxymethylbilane synthase [Mobiluncus mulieris]|uniref:hydroxymethylbilane synthase n=1 Tax=Mobiluncus mulieris TaxID=2052 RepID=UPI0001E51136|nr:hydroxymethylbilane synthase [Mobiluncus mulieris]EFN94214.1 hydroxymethylbilane synthase [Mobiluncus mulieris FB024-16]MCU9997117.1 hydroxymethylbilane synthase [Mobiluncus mulieris]MCV0014562.1 hydroxymethylbilane synthase [Mobiluncus mulieris]NMW61296.1 hydroxymethylbilane synthase [Mobiluncus mulieris]